MRNILHISLRTAALASLLVLEVALTILLRTLGWFGTGNAVQLVACSFLAVVPLVVAILLLGLKRFQFGVTSLMVVVALVATFLTISLRPVLEYRSARRASIQLVSVSATLNEEDFEDFYSGLGLRLAPKSKAPRLANITPWLAPLVKDISAIPADNEVRSIFINSDAQVEILASHWQRFPSLQTVSITAGVSDVGLEVLSDTLPRFERLHTVHTNDVRVPNDWYRSLTNVRALLVWGEGRSRGKAFPNRDLTEIASLPKLSIFMVLGYAFTDADARTLSTSRSLKRVVLRGTKVTATGEADLANGGVGRVVYRN